MKSPRASNILRTWRRQLCIVAGWCSRDVIHIRWTSKRKSATLRTIVLELFDYRFMKHYKFSITFKSELLLGHPKLSRLLPAAGPWYSQCGVHGSIMHEHGWSCNGWLSRCGTAWVWRTSSKFCQTVMFALDLDHWQFAIMGKVPQHHDGSICLCMSSLDTGRMGMLKWTFWHPQHSPYRAYLSSIPHTVLPGYQRFDQWLQPSYPPRKSLLHAIVEHR